MISIASVGNKTLPTARRYPSRESIFDAHKAPRLCFDYTSNNNFIMTLCVHIPALRGGQKGGLHIAGHKKMDFTFAKQLERLMRERQMYPSQVARITGIRRQRVQEYLSGERQPTAYIIKLFAERLQVSADWLLNIKNRPL